MWIKLRLEVNKTNKKKNAEMLDFCDNKYFVITKNLITKWN